MKNLILSAALSFGLLLGSATPGAAMVRHRTYYRTHYRSRARYVRHKRHMQTVKRVGIGAAGGAVIGGIAGGGAGAAIGGVAGAGAGALYDAHEKHKGH